MVDETGLGVMYAQADERIKWRGDDVDGDDRD